MTKITYLKDIDGNDTIFPDFTSMNDTVFLKNRVWSDLKWFFGGLVLVGGVDWDSFWKHVQSARRAEREVEEIDMREYEDDDQSDL